MQKSDYFAEFRPLFRKIVARQKAKKELKLLHIHFTAPAEEVAQMAKLARMIIDEGPGEKDQNLIAVPFLMFIIKMFDGIVDKSTEPLLLDFTVTGAERELAVMMLTEIIEVHSTERVDEWADTLILINSFIKRIQANNPHLA